ncbi:MAG: GNAT family N-acetyltransferase [Pseudomonadota bacterium]
MAERNIIIKKLGPPDVDDIRRFRLHNDDDVGLRIFIRRDARKSAAANLTQTYVAKFEGEKKIIGYISIMCAEIRLEKTYELQDKDGADRYDFHPAIRISRLAVEDDQRGKRIGQKLVETVLGIVLLSVVPGVGCRFLILDAKQKSVDFYRKRGFRLLDTEENKKKTTPLMFLDLRNHIDDLNSE